VVLKDMLGFTEGQLADLHALQDARRQAVEALQPRIAEAERALAEALNGAQPEACDVGGKLLAVNALRKQVGQAEQTFRAGVAALLTEAQKAKVEEIFALQASLHAAEVLHRLGL
jgi:Spy/CpxP family protein refolding chaperone